MYLLYLSFRNLLYRRLFSLLSILLLTLGVGLVALIWAISQRLENSFYQNIRGIDVVVGAKGSPLQLLLSAVYQIDAPTGNISLAIKDSLNQHPLVKLAIPLAYGDSYQGYRLVGTDSAYFTHFKTQLATGKMWQQAGEVVLGADIARELQLQLGQQFKSAHGLVQNDEALHNHPYTVVGILQPTGGVVDKLLLTSIESFWHAHELDEAPAAEREITALLIKCKNPMGLLQLPRWASQQPDLIAALPAVEVNRLLGLFGIGMKTLQAIGLAIIIVSCLSIFIALYQSLSQRRYEMALLRCLGAGRWQLFSLVIAESLWLGIAGLVAGLFLSRGALWAIQHRLPPTFALDSSQHFWQPAYAYIAIGVLVLCCISAVLPAIQTARLNISATLAEP